MGWFAPFISGLFGVLAGISAQWWRSSRDELRMLCDELCRMVSGTAQAGAAYWTSDTNLEIQETQLHGAQQIITGLGTLIGEQLYEAASDDIDGATAKFFAALTGGDFSIPNRPKNLLQAQQCHETAADVILAVRQGFFYGVRFREKVWRATIGRMWPKSTWHGTFGEM